MDDFEDPLALRLHVHESEVAESVRLLGEHLKGARLRRNMTMETLEDLSGVNRRTLSEAERGNPRTSVGAYVAYLRALGIGEQLEDLATAERDIDDLSAETGRKRARTGRPKT